MLIELVCRYVKEDKDTISFDDGERIFKFFKDEISYTDIGYGYYNVKVDRGVLNDREVADV